MQHSVFVQVSPKLSESGSGACVPRAMTNLGWGDTLDELQQRQDAVCRTYGRRRKRIYDGTFDNAWFSHAKAHGAVYNKRLSAQFHGRTFARFARENASGVFLVQTTRHVCLAVNGKLVDSHDTRQKRVRNVFDVPETAIRPGTVNDMMLQDNDIANLRASELFRYEPVAECAIVEASNMLIAIRSLRTNGETYWTIANWLNSCGVPTANGKTWTDNSVKHAIDGKSPRNIRVLKQTQSI